MTLSPPPPEAPLPLEPKCPKALKVVSVIGIILGVMGVLCVCMGLVGVLMNGQQQQEMMHASLAAMMVQIATSVAGILISTFLLIACIGALGLRPWSAMMMVVINIINILFETFKLVAGLVYGIPKAVEQMRHIPDDASEQQIQAMQKIQPFLGYIRIGIYVITVGIFVIQMIYSFSVLRVMKRADVKAALANPNDLPQMPMM